MTAMLGVVVLTMLFQRAGLYHTVAASTSLQGAGAKKNGGILLDTNNVGAIVSSFAVPNFLLLRAADMRKIGIWVLVGAIPVLVMTFSRSGILAFVASVLFLAALDRKRLTGARIAVTAAAFGGLWIATLGAGPGHQLLERYASQRSDTNAIAQRRVSIWHQTIIYLDIHPSRWIWGGGLDDFKNFAVLGPLGNGFAPHSLILRLLTDGGFVMLSVYFALLLVLLVEAGIRTSLS